MKCSILLVCLVAVAGISGCDDDPADPDSGLDGDVESDADAVDGDADADSDGDGDVGDADMPDDGDVDADEDTIEPPTDPIGQLNVMHILPDALYATNEIYAHAVFSPELAEAGLEDPVGLLALWPLDVFMQDGYWPIPELGESEVIDYGTVWRPFPEITTLDAGGYVMVGEHIFAYRDDFSYEVSDFLLYEAPAEETAELYDLQPLDEVMDIEIEGGPDISTQALAGVVEIPPPIEVTSHDLTIRYRIRYGNPVEFTWEPEGDDSILFAVLGKEWGFAYNLEDTGSIDFPYLDETAAGWLGVSPEFQVTRYRRREVQLEEGMLTVLTASKQWIFGLVVGSYEIQPASWDAGTITDVRISYWDGTFDPSDLNLEIDADVEVLALDVVDAENHTLNARIRVPADVQTGVYDIAVGSSGAPEVVAERYVWIVDELPGAGDCESAVDEGLVPVGAYRSTDEGLPHGSWDTSVCDMREPRGREQVVPVSLTVGQTLDAQLIRIGNGRAIMYLVDSCDAAAARAPCVMAPGPAFEGRLRYTALEDEEILLVLDSTASEDEEPALLYLDLQIHDAAPFMITPDVLVDGEETTVELLSFSGDWTEDELELDFGPSVTVESITVPGGTGPVAQVEVTVDPTAGPDTVSVSAERSDGTVVARDALTLISLLPTSSTCEEADDLEPLGPGSYTGYIDETDSDELNLISCSGAGPEAVYRVRVGPGETVRAVTTIFDSDVVFYLLTSCDDLPLYCGDSGGGRSPELTEWTTTADGGIYYLAIDGSTVNDWGFFTLDIATSL